MKNTEKKNDILLHTVPTLYATIRPVWKYLSHSAQACYGKFQVFSLSCPSLPYKGFTARNPRIELGIHFCHWLAPYVIGQPTPDCLSL